MNMWQLLLMVIFTHATSLSAMKNIKWEIFMNIRLMKRLRKNLQDAMYIPKLPAGAAGLSFTVVADVMPIIIFIMVIYISHMSCHAKL